MLGHVQIKLQHRPRMVPGTLVINGDSAALMLQVHPPKQTVIRSPGFLRLLLELADFSLPPATFLHKSVDKQSLLSSQAVWSGLHGVFAFDSSSASSQARARAS